MHSLGAMSDFREGCEPHQCRLQIIGLEKIPSEEPAQLQESRAFRRRCIQHISFHLGLFPQVFLLYIHQNEGIYI